MEREYWRCVALYAPLVNLSYKLRITPWYWDKSKKKFCMNGSLIRKILFSLNLVLLFAHLCYFIIRFICILQIENIPFYHKMQLVFHVLVYSINLSAATFGSIPNYFTLHIVMEENAKVVRAFHRTIVFAIFTIFFSIFTSFYYSAI